MKIARRKDGRWTPENSLYNTSIVIQRPKSTTGPLASQSPHVFWIGGDRLLGVAGGYSPDVVGGAALHPLSLGSSQWNHFVFLGGSVVGPEAGNIFDYE